MPFNADAVSNVVPCGVFCRDAKRGLRDIDAKNLPALLGQPECVIPFGASQVQGVTWRSTFREMGKDF